MIVKILNELTHTEIITILPCPNREIIQWSTGNRFKGEISIDTAKCLHKILILTYSLSSNPAWPYSLFHTHTKSYTDICESPFSCQSEKKTNLIATNIVKNHGTSPVVQWLRIHLVIQETQVQSLFRELRSHMLCSSKAYPTASEACRSQSLHHDYRVQHHKERSHMMQWGYSMLQLTPDATKWKNIS